MTTAWFHCFAGTAGDMTMASLVHAGADPVAIAEMLSGVDLDGYAMSFERVQRCGIVATQAHVAVHAPHHDHVEGHVDGGVHSDSHDHPHRPYRDIRTLLEQADLPDRVRQRSLRVFAVLAEVEAAMHGVATDEVEFHEVGSVDAIVDVVGTCAALESLGVDTVSCSTITVGRGTVRTAHGELPNPAPAVAGLLARRQVPTLGIDDGRELATPTGVALMVALADTFGPLPTMQVRSVGYGAGSADVPGRPNVVQVVVGDEVVAAAVAPGPGQPVQVFETNVDDATGEVVAHAIAALLAAGAHDAWATPIVMKKGRPAYTVHALCDPAHADAVVSTLVRETGSLGVRGHSSRRWPQQRAERVVEVDGHPVRVKVSAGRVKPEHDDAVAVAAATGRALRAVLDDAVRLALSDRD
ncbi:MAG: nickel pincer cofactor biosynthesis protein LarC [Ilumatobacteraceae bacterium]